MVTPPYDSVRAPPAVAAAAILAGSKVPRAKTNPWFVPGVALAPTVSVASSNSLTSLVGSKPVTLIKFCRFC